VIFFSAKAKEKISEEDSNLKVNDQVIYDKIRTVGETK